jgi:signal transduction histidine kinase
LEDAKEIIASSITRAQTDLVLALSELEKMPAFDPSSVAFAAHALNSFLTVTEGTVGLILMRLESHPDDQLRLWLEVVRHATALMGHTVSQLMTASATTDTKLRFEKVDLLLLVERVCAYYAGVALRKKIRISNTAAKDVPQVWTDRVAVAAVLDNLLSNAVKYSQPETQIGVQVRGEPGFAICSVQDEGPGLSLEDQAKLFQRGVRLTPIPTGGETSTGYGLAVARDLIEKLDGKIWCESVLGQGSCFSFRLPAYCFEVKK